MFDIIGDIHGQAERLRQLLAKLGYQTSEHGYYHPEYKAVFVGDLIDRGPLQLETLNIVKEMVDNQQAYIVMGNHEFNAIGWCTPNQQREASYLRQHTTSNYKQHQVFLTQIGEHSTQHQYWSNWFKSLPLFLDLADIRVIHACWDSEVINHILPYLDGNNCLKSNYIQQAFDSSSKLYDYCEVLLKGKEINLPSGINYLDKEGTRRHKSRIKWWLTHASTFNQLCLIPDDERILALEQPIDYQAETYHGSKPVFFGHYWLTGLPTIQTEKIACVDYSAAIESGKLVAYRWQGENILTNKHFIY